MAKQMIVTVGTGARAFDNGGQGLNEDDAAAALRDRNDRAKELGIETRYTATDFVALPK
jgi:hypothetical protein